MIREYVVSIKDWGDVTVRAAWAEQAVECAVEEYFSQNNFDPNDFQAEAECEGQKFVVRSSVSISFYAEESKNE